MSNEVAATTHSGRTDAGNVSRRKPVRHSSEAPGRVWHGMAFDAWMRQLSRAGWKLTPGTLPLSLSITAAAALNSVAHGFEEVFVNRGIDRVAIEHPPVFVLGHWRSGTTLLHELLIRDPQFSYPTTYQCILPSHFGHTGYLKPLLGLLLPSQRPMDEMAFGWERPQEDEFALCNLGLPSPYWWIAFPDQADRFRRYLDFADATDQEREAWKRGFLRLLRRMTRKDSRRLVLKSPTHTARIRLLRELFPGAKFVHVSRDPMSVVPSTLRMWSRLMESHRLGRGCDGLDREFVVETFERMYRRYEEDVALLPPGTLSEIRFEELTTRPVDVLERVYDELKLDGFEAARPGLQAYWDRHRDHQPRHHQVPPELTELITARLVRYIERYGYAA